MVNDIRIIKPWSFPKHEGEEVRKSWISVEMGEGAIGLFDALLKIVSVANNYRHIKPFSFLLLILKGNQKKHKARQNVIIGRGGVLTM